MSMVEPVIARLRAWEQRYDSENPFQLVCRIQPGATREEVAEAFPNASVTGDLLSLWLSTGEAWLFQDIDYGQWGLHLLTPRDSAARTAEELASRPEDYRPGDVVVGEFLGDSDLMVFSPYEAPERRYLVAPPLDPRDEWFSLAASAAEFLEKYLASEGAKYWE